MRFLFPIAGLFLFVFTLESQTAYRENGRWGARNGTAIIVPPKFDTLIGFDPTGKVCLGCFKMNYKGGSSSLRVTSVYYNCNYLNGRGERLVIRNMDGDTSSIFSLGRHTVQEFNTSASTMVVSSRRAKHLVTKDFRQLTFKGYHNVFTTSDPNFYVAETESESETIYAGLISREEREVVPYRYTSISLNAADSLIVACSAGLYKGTDDLYDYKGKKIASSSRHIQQASRTFLVQKIFEPQVRYFLYNRKTGTESPVDADEILLAANDQVLLRRKKNWYAYDTQTGENKPIKQPTHEQNQGGH